MPLANPATTLTTANQAVIISYSQRSTGPGPGPCHWRNAGPMLLADDTGSSPTPRLSELHETRKRNLLTSCTATCQLVTSKIRCK